jgi:tetratricopeptide (TPR) repeat protein
MEFKYNPGFSSDKDLIDSFVVRQQYLELILENLRENTGTANQHVLVVGARGTGKTMLVRRVAAEVRTDPRLNAQWYPLVFAEESYQITSVGEFWLETLFHLADQTQEKSWQTVYEELRTEADETRLRQRALAQLMDFADVQGKRILLVVENLNMLFAEQLSEHDDWELRYTLQNEPRLMLLGTATQRFEQIEAIQKAWFEFFTIYSLEALSLEDCRVLWTGITGKPVQENRLKPIRILTGGNPRLLRILIDFAEDLSLKDLMANLSQLIDEHTDYFKSHLDNLATSERKVFIALLDLWDPKGAREIATISRMGVSQTSSLLNRLVSRGAVMVVVAKGRKKLYQASERLYNIYYLMRHRSHPSSRVQAAVTFMVNFYQGDELVDATSRLVNEACLLDPAQRRDHFWAYKAILEATSQPELRDQLSKATPTIFLGASDAPEFIRQLLEPSPLNQEEGWELFTKGRELYESGHYKEAIKTFYSVIKIQPNSKEGWALKGSSLGILGKYKESVISFDKALKINSNDPEILFLKGVSLSCLNYFDEALRTFNKVLEIKPNEQSALRYRGMTLCELGKYEEGINSLNKAIELKPDDFMSLAYKGGKLASLGRYKEAVDMFNKVLEIKPSDYETWHIRGILLRNLGHYKEAIESHNKALEIKPNFCYTLDEKGYALFLLKSYEEAEISARKAIKIKPNDWKFLFNLGLILEAQKKWPEFISLIPQLLDIIEIDLEAIQVLTNFSITGAAVGYASTILININVSSVTQYLEPLVVGLQIFLGEEPLVAQEILEVGQDVAQRIRERQKVLAESSSSYQPLRESSSSN